MNKIESFKIILDQLKDNNISEYIFLNQSDISYSQRLRDYCELFCPNFNKSWRCPPNIGSIDENIARCKQYKYGLLLSAYLELDDETIEKSDEDIYVICRRKLNPVFHKIGKQIEKFVGQQVLTRHLLKDSIM